MSSKSLMTLSAGSVRPGLFSPALWMHLLLLATAATLAAGLILPTVELQELVFRKNRFSILDGIQTLYQEKYYFLALIIFVFSIVFPVFKIAALSVLWLIPMGQRARGIWIRTLESLGKWSMLDVFVVALMIIVTRTSGLINAKPLPGIYFFAASVILAMFASALIHRLHKKTA